LTAACPPAGDSGLARVYIHLRMKRPRASTFPRPWRETSHYAIAALVLLATGAGAVVLLHVLSPEVSPASHYVSEYGNRTWGWLLSVALVLIAGGLAALGAVLGDDFRARSTRARMVPRLLQVSGAMLVVAALFSTDRLGGEVEVATLAGKVHGVMAIGAFCLLVLAMVLVSPRLNDDDELLGRSSALALPVAMAAPAIAAVVFAIRPEADGLRQRMFLAIVFGWLLATAFHVYSLRNEAARTGREDTG
jgi:hypothetical protein